MRNKAFILLLIPLCGTLYAQNINPGKSGGGLSASSVSNIVNAAQAWTNAAGKITPLGAPTLVTNPVTLDVAGLTTLYKSLTLARPGTSDVALTNKSGLLAINTDLDIDGNFSWEGNRVMGLNSTTMSIASAARWDTVQIWCDAGSDSVNFTHDSSDWGQLLPDSNNNWYLGGPALRWKSVFSITNDVTRLTASFASIPTNTASYSTTSNPTNQFAADTVYTNSAQRSLLIGSAILNGGVSGSANITLFYTNNAVGYRLPMQTGAGLATTDIFPFCVPLSPSATFTFVSTMGTGATGSLTNVVNWLQ